MTTLSRLLFAGFAASLCMGLAAGDAQRGRVLTLSIGAGGAVSAGTEQPTEMWLFRQ